MHLDYENEDEFDSKNEKSLPNLSVRQGQIGGWEFAMLSFPTLALGAPA